jgi:cell division transport system permease protein
MKARPSAPRQDAHSARSQMRARLQHHRAMASDSLLRVWRAPLSTLMTVTVIGIALLLPALLLMAMTNLSGLGRGVEDTSQITLYLHRDLSAARLDEMRDQLQQDGLVRQLQYVSSAQALAEFRERSGLADVIDALEGNPLPASLVIFPGTVEPAAVQQLLTQLNALPEVESAQFDLQWLQRLQGLMAIVQRAVLALAVLLAVGVLFVVGNTIRMAIEGRRAEVLVVKLVGGSNSFIARPFLYTGLWYGLLGGLLAWLGLLLLMLAFTAPIARLLALYSSQYALQGPGIWLALMLPAAGALLGWAGAALSVRQHLVAIEPR